MLSLRKQSKLKQMQSNGRPSANGGVETNRLRTFNLFHVNGFVALTNNELYSFSYFIP
ncbi:hypothetical protein CGLO_16766 [Colletotrichum gloeosporioides Cg-14]|uniref:Uncharacterized protein n=1 Tax=Colletotrichum gloeosporioides (strain Cg-14) TaxID=1237896 RepID=T0JMW8_COLGC|nr:hypothetical protein CGLO_16766 [Colletotrichum gloeosporioides Cg-14]